MNWVSTTKPVAGRSVVRTGVSRARVTKGTRLARRQACSPMAAQETISSTASQNGKNPLSGPSVPQPIPSRRESQITRTPPAIRISAVVRSAVRMRGRRLLLQEAAFRHQVLVKLLGLAEPLHELGTGFPGGLERALVEVILELRRVVDLPEQALVPVQRLLGHVGGAEDAAQHQVADVRAHRFLHGGDVLPLGDRDPRGIEDGQRPYPPRLPVAGAL